MGKSEDGSDEIAEVVTPGTTIELLKRPESSSNNNREEGRTLSSNETKPEAKQEFQIAFNFENKSVSAKESENKLNNTVEKDEQKEQKSIEPKPEIKVEVKLDIKPESGKSWVERVENTKKQFDGEKNKIENKSNSFEDGNKKEEKENKVVEPKQKTWTQKVEGTKRAYNDDNHRAKGKSLYEIKPAAANTPNQNPQAPTPIPPNQNAQSEVKKESWIEKVEGSQKVNQNNLVKAKNKNEIESRAVVAQTMKEGDANHKSQLKLRAEQIAKSNTVSKQPTPNILPSK